MSQKSFDIKTLKGSNLIALSKNETALKTVKECLNQLNATSNNGLVSVIAHENSDFTAEKSMSGVSVRFSANAPALSLLPVMDDLGGRVGVYKIPASCTSGGSGFDSASTVQNTFRTKAIAANFEEDDPLTSAPCNIHEVSGESTGWKLEPGSDGRHFYGVFGGPEGEQRRGAKPREYFIVASSGAQEQTQQLRDWISDPKNAGLTIRDVASSPQYKRLQLTSDRNNRAVIARICSLLDLDANPEVQRQLVSDREMSNIHPSYEPRQLIAENALASMTRYGGIRLEGEEAVVYPKLISLSSCNGTAVAIPVDPLTGVSLVGRGQTSPTDSSALWNIGSSISNSYNNVVPLGGARYLSTEKTPKLTNDDIGAAKRVLFWKGKNVDAGLQTITTRIERAKEPLFLSDDVHYANHGFASLKTTTLQPVAVVVNI